MSGGKLGRKPRRLGDVNIFRVEEGRKSYLFPLLFHLTEIDHLFKENVFIIIQCLEDSTLAQLKNSLSQILEGDQTEAFKNKAWLENREVDTRGRIRHVGKHIPMDQRHMSKNDRMSIIQGIRAEIIQEVRDKIVQEVQEEVKSKWRQHKRYKKE
ncbi:hypothetical protein ACH5RR_015391 [Cinchona calisaya]|uniref:Uncharacterized protein n=1 Tax=Cinchona calisaya TaxID=153742 RepID=A0ABD2ZWL8_9GENT